MKLKKQTILKIHQRTNLALSVINRHYGGSLAATLRNLRQAKFL